MSKLMLKNVRLSFPSLFEHAQYQGNSLEKYEATFLLPKDGDDAKAVQAAIKAVGTEVLGKEWSKAKLCLLDGDTKDYDGYEGMMALKASTKKATKKPQSSTAAQQFNTTAERQPPPSSA